MCGQRYRVLIDGWKPSGTRHCTKPKGHQGKCGKAKQEQYIPKGYHIREDADGERYVKNSDAEIARLEHKAANLQQLRNAASTQAAEASLLTKDLTLQCNDAWRAYHEAKRQQRKQTK